MLRTERPHRSWRAGLALGFVIAGVAALVCAAWVLEPDLLPPHPDRRVFSWLTALMLAVPPVALLLPVFWGVPVLRTSERGRRRQWIALVIMVGGFALAAGLCGLMGLLDQLDHGFPGRTTLLALIGGAAVVAGSVLSVRAIPPRRRLPDNPLATVLAVGVVAAVAAPLVLTAETWPEASTTAAAVRPASPPNTLTRIAWTKPFHGAVDQVLPAGAGVVVLAGNRVQALDGTTGALRWQYRRSGANIAGIAASPDGATVAVGINARDSWVSTLLLDAITGRIRARVAAVPRDDWAAARPELSNGALIVRHHGFTAYSPRDGRRLWHYTAPLGCTFDDQQLDSLVTPDGIASAVFCEVPNTEELIARYVFLDGPSGRVRWQREVAGAADGYHGHFGLTPSVAPDGRVLFVRVEPDRARPGSSSPPTHLLALNASTGIVLRDGVDVRELLPGGRAIAGRNAIVDLGTGRVVGHDRSDSCIDGIIVSLPASPQCVAGTGAIDTTSTTATVSIGTLDGPSRNLSLPIGEPDPARPATRAIQAVVAAGAVVAWTRERSYAGDTTEVTGGTTNVIGLA